MRVLICEDEPLIAACYRVELEMAGHEVVAITSRPDEGLKAGRLHQPDVAVVDLHLGDGLRGEGLVEDLADLGIPSIIVSGQTGLSRLDTRAQGVLRKSPRRGSLLRALRLMAWARGIKCGASRSAATAGGR